MANPLTNRKFIHFNYLKNFEEQLEAGSILDTQIVFIKDARRIWTHGTFYTLDERITQDIYNKLSILANISADIISKLDDVQFILAGPTEDRPPASTIHGDEEEQLKTGFCYFDTTLGEPIWWNGEDWVDAYGNQADIPHKGTISERPNISDVNVGFEYTDTTNNNLYISNGSEWIHLNPNVWVTIN